jgi:hypothetical protein
MKRNGVSGRAAFIGKGSNRFPDTNPWGYAPRVGRVARSARRWGAQAAAGSGDEI